MRKTLSFFAHSCYNTSGYIFSKEVTVTRNQKKQSLYNVRFAVLMLISLFVVAVVYAAFDHRIDWQIESSTHQRIDEYAVRQKNHITSVLESRYSLLNSYATFFGDELLRDVEAFDKLSRTLLLIGDFDQLLTIDTDGNYRINTGETGHGSNPVGRQLLLSYNQSISRPFRAYYHNNDLCILLSVPLTNDEGTHVGMLSASYTAQRFARLLLQDNYRDAAFSLLTDAEGNLLFSSSASSIFVPDSTSPADKRVVPSSTFFDEESSAAIRASMARREHNLYTIVHNQIEYVVVQTPIEQNNWMLFCMIPTSVLAEDYAAITRLRHLQMFIIFLMMAFIALYTVLHLLRDWRRLRKENAVLTVLASTDSMTGLLNQGTTSENITSELRAHAGEGMLLLLDMDNLKSINDTLGHPIGDRAILVLSDLMRDIFADAPVIGRVGGDEFMIFLSRPRSREVVLEHIRQLQSRLNEAMKNDLPARLTLHCSVGLAYARPGDDYTSLYSRADVALYHIKRHGKDGYCFFEDLA